MQVEMPLVRLLRFRLPRGALFSGHTAGWLHALDMPPCEPVEVTVPRRSPTSRLAGASLTRSDVPDDEACVVRGLPATTPTRTVADLGRRLPLVEAVVVLDMALNRRLVQVDELKRWAGQHRRFRGVSRLLRAIEWADDRSQSPMESRLRMLLRLSGLPKPVLQQRLEDETGWFIGQPDLYYPDARLAIEYDGDAHRVTFAYDNRRQNRLLEAGYKLLRFTASDIYVRPASVVGQVERALRYSIGSPN